MRQRKSEINEVDILLASLMTGNVACQQMVLEEKEIDLQVQILTLVDDPVDLE